MNFFSTLKVSKIGKTVFAKKSPIMDVELGPKYVSKNEST